MLNEAQLIRPGGERWDSARAAWNLAIDQRPAVVAQPHDADGVAAVVNFARENGLRVAVQAEGHGAGAPSWCRRGHALTEDGAHDRGRDRRGEPAGAGQRGCQVA